MKYNPNGYVPKDYAKEGYINKGNFFGFTRWEKPEATIPNSAMPQSSASSPMPAYVDGQQPMAQQQQAQPLPTPRATTGRFSFNQGNFRIGDSTMNSSDAGLNI
jgi:hypothetical protein